MPGHVGEAKRLKVLLLRKRTISQEVFVDEERDQN